MEIIVSAKHYEIDDELKALAETQTKKLESEFELQKLTSLRIVFSLERNWHIADALLNGKRFTFNAKAVSNDMRVSLAKVIEKLEKQMRRYIEKTKTVYTKPDHAMKEKIWTSAELVEENEAEEYIEDVIDEK
jgi:putative sigma-54 modulation protein